MRSPYQISLPAEKKVSVMPRKCCRLAILPSLDESLSLWKPSKTLLFILKIWLLFALITTHCFAVRYLVMLFTGKEFDLWVIGALANATTAALSLDYLLKKRKTVSTVISALYEDILQRPVSIARVRRKVKLVFVLSAIYLSIMFTLNVISASVKCQNKTTSVWWIRMMLFGWDRELSTPQVCFLMIVDNVTLVVCIIGCLTFLGAAYSVLCIFLIQIMESFNTTLLKEVQSVDYLTPAKISDLRRRFQKISQLVDTVNEGFQYVFMFWCILSVISTCHTLAVPILRYGSREYEGVAFTIYYVVKYSQPVYVLLAVALTASHVRQKAQYSLTYAKQLSQKTMSEPNLCSGELLLLINQISSPAVALSVGGCFEISKHFCISFLLAETTYALVLIQLRPDLMDKLASHKQQIQQLNNG